MIARPKISRNEWKSAELEFELGAFEVGNFASRPAQVLARLDRAFEASLGFAYVDETPGAFAVRPPPPETDWLTWR